MSFGLPSVKTKPTCPDQFEFKEGPFGVPDVMTYGVAAAKPSLDVPHPVMQTELNYKKNLDQMNTMILRNTQGLHAPLRLSMELKAAKKVGHLPFLPSTNVMLDVLTGRDLEIGPEDVFNLPEFREVGGQPHAIVERSLGLL